MGLFGNRKAPAPADAERLASVEADVRALRRDVADLDERFVAWMRRAEKRVRDAGPPAAPVNGQGLPDPVRRLMERRTRHVPED